MADLRDYTKKNTVFEGTDGIKLPRGNNAQRTASSNVAGTMRFNTDIDGIETYTTAGWRPLAAPPSISTVSPSTFSGESGTEFTINGDGFTPDAQVYFVTSNGTAILASTVSYYSAVQVRATTPRAIRVQEEPISVRVVQQSGTTTKTDCIDAGGVPNWITTAGTLGSIFGANTVNVYVSATDPEGTSVTYQITSGSLPNGLSLSSANGLIQGLANSVLANTTYNFTIKANDTVNNNTDRSFSYTVLNRAPVINTAAGNLGTIYSGNAVSASISAYDPDGGQVTYSVSSGTLPVNSSLGSANGVITGTPVVTTNTIYSFTITSTDEGSLTASNNYTYTVLNRPPLWNTDATLTSYSAETFTPITVNAYDPDGGSITYSLTSGSVPSGLTFVSANATITGTASDVDSNTTSTFTVNATDVGEMSNTRTFSLTITPIIDNQFSNTVLLLKTAGNTVIADASSNNLNLISYADARASNFSPYNSSWSNYLSDALIRVPYSVPVNISSGDFTIEFWIYGPPQTNGSVRGFIFFNGSPANSSAIGWEFIFGTDGSISFAWNSASTFGLSAASALNRKWNHIAVTRSGNTFTMYLNGTSTGTTTYANACNSDPSWGVYIGSRGATNTGACNDLHFSNVRIIKGNALYTGTGSNVFVPSTTPLTAIANTVLLTCQSNRFIDNSNTASVFTFGGDSKIVGWSPFAETDTSNGSMYFDGTGDYVQMGTPYNFASNNFTVEGWFYLTNISSAALWGGSNGGGIVSKFQAYISSGTLGIDLNGSSIISVTASSYLKAYSWNHIAVCRGGTSTSQTALFINGVRAGTGTMGSQTGVTTNFGIGYMELGAITASYISNFRIVDGTDVYGYTNTTYTVPPSPLTNIANTKLLTLQNRQPHNNHGFQDKSNNKFLLTRAGNASLGTFSPFSAEPGKWSTNYDGNSDYITTASQAGYNLNLYNNWTIEGWFYKTGSLVDTQTFASLGSGGSSYYWTITVGGTNGTVGFSVGPGNWNVSSSATSGTGVISLNRWHHVAWVRNGSGTLKMYVDGVEVYSSTSFSFGSATHGGSLHLGTYFANYNNDGSWFDGYVSNFRIVNGTSVYTSAFTSPTSPLSNIANTVLLTSHANRLYNEANTITAFTVSGGASVRPFSPFTSNTPYSVATVGGSAYFDGTGDYLEMADNNAFWYRSGDFSLECWQYLTSAPSTAYTISQWATAPAKGIILGYASSRVILYYSLDGSADSSITDSTSVSSAYSGQWIHIAACRTGSTLSLFVNGKRVATATQSGTFSNSGNIIRIGSHSDGAASSLITGYLSDVRSMIGFSAYDATQTTITVPTGPLKNITNTAFLLDTTNAAIVDYTAKHNFETTGDVKANNSVYKFSPGSIILDGNDYLLTPFSPHAQLSTGNFTIEFWIRAGASGTYNQVIGTLVSAADAGCWRIGNRYNSGNSVYFARGNGTGFDEAVYTVNVNDGNWHHVACVRISGVIYMYVDGVAQTLASGSASISGTCSSSNALYVGYNGRDTSYFLGNLSDVRVTRSARYTANFTPPTRTFPIR